MFVGCHDLHEPITFHRLPPIHALTMGCPGVKSEFLIRSCTATPIAAPCAVDALGSSDQAARKTERSPPAWRFLVNYACWGCRKLIGRPNDFLSGSGVPKAVARHN